MSEETYRIFKVILMFIFAFIAWSYIQTLRYSTDGLYLIDKIDKTILKYDREKQEYETLK
jgi:hypothetical protein